MRRFFFCPVRGWKERAWRRASFLLSFSCINEDSCSDRAGLRLMFSYPIFCLSFPFLSLLKKMAAKFCHLVCAPSSQSQRIWSFLFGGHFLFQNHTEHLIRFVAQAVCMLWSRNNISKQGDCILVFFPSHKLCCCFIAFCFLFIKCVSAFYFQPWSAKFSHQALHLEWCFPLLSSFAAGTCASFPLVAKTPVVSHFSLPLLLPPFPPQEPMQQKTNKRLKRRRTGVFGVWMPDDKIGGKEKLSNVSGHSIFSVCSVCWKLMYHHFPISFGDRTLTMPFLLFFLLLFHVLVVCIHTFIVYRDGKLTRLAFCQPRQETPKILVSCRCLFWHCSRNCQPFGFLVAPRCLSLWELRIPPTHAARLVV